MTRGSPWRRLPGLASSGTAGAGHLPLQRRDRPGLAPGSLTARLSRRTLSSRAGVLCAASPALAARRPLGGTDLRAVLGARPRHGARDLGPRPAKDRALLRVRGARRAAPARPRAR